MKKRQLLLTITLAILLGVYGFSQNTLSINPVLNNLNTEESITKGYEKVLKDVNKHNTFKANSSNTIEARRPMPIWTGPRTESCFWGFVTIRYTVIWDNGQTTVEGGTYYCGCSCPD